MDKRHLAIVFSDRLKLLLGSDKNGIAQFLRCTSVDRSALSHFLDSESVRLPRAETLRRIAESYGVSIDWLLGMENSPEGRQQIASSMEIESQVQIDGTTSLSHWYAEAADFKLRYVPSALPDMMNLSSEITGSSNLKDVQQSAAENILGSINLSDIDLEIAMPIQTLKGLASQNGIWQGCSGELCKQQLLHMAKICEDCYPGLRLHLYDGCHTFSVPYMIFGKQRIAVYIGEAYLVITTPSQVRTFAQKFDKLVRQTIVSPDKVHLTLAKLANNIIT